jgi:chemotaxis signal transduction protein
VVAVAAEALLEVLALRLVAVTVVQDLTLRRFAVKPQEQHVTQVVAVVVARQAVLVVQAVAVIEALPAQQIQAVAAVQTRHLQATTAQQAVRA